MSTETIEAVFRYSQSSGTELMLIASKNQIDYSGGYVNGWTTDQYGSFINYMCNQYPRSNVRICRDHCGPGFNGVMSPCDTYRTIDADIDNGFDLIHIDFCLYNGSKEQQIKESKRAIKYCLDHSDGVAIEIGTDENTGLCYSLESISDIAREVDSYGDVICPDFFVVQTGSLVVDIRQAGSFNSPFVSAAKDMLAARGIRLKEHNADYLSKSEISKRIGVVDAMNIAPQVGVMQTGFVLNKCLAYGIDFNDFANVVYAGGKWEKWIRHDDVANRLLCVYSSGHYYFASDEYRRIIDDISRHENIHENIIEVLTSVINHYEDSY